MNSLVILNPIGNDLIHFHPTTHSTPRMANAGEQAEERNTRSATGDENEAGPNMFSCLYFGFASNLSPRTLQQRCPGSLYVGLAVLKGWRFIISEVGFGNIVPGSEDDEVWGTLHFLTHQSEAALDQSEEVPSWHQKKKLKVTRLMHSRGEGEKAEGEEVEATTYVDVDRTTEGMISKEYVIWMRKAIEDGLKCGVSQSYVDRYLTKFLPEDKDVGKEDQVMMIRTIQFDKNNLSYVPKDLLDHAGSN